MKIDPQRGVESRQGKSSLAEPFSEQAFSRRALGVAASGEEPIIVPRTRFRVVIDASGEKP
ncbi:MAG: hypothetical protein ABI767_02035 [Rhodanobacter sp.]